MSRSLLKEWETKTHWTQGDIEMLARARPGVRVWAFAGKATFTDDALAPLKDAAQMQFLAFKEAQLSRENMLALADVPKLVRLHLHGCTFAKNVFADLCDAFAGDSAPKLSELWLEDTTVGDAELENMGKIERLRWVILSGTKITDAGLAHLQTVRKLETLWLDRTEITDDGVLGLAVLPKLSIVVARETACSPDIKERLFAAQTELKKSKKPLDAEQVRAADTRLRAFLRAMNEWETAAWKRAKSIEDKYRAQRPQASTLSEGESAASKVFWQEIGAQKAQIASAFCTEKLIGRGAGKAQSYGNPPAFAEPKGGWIATETPSKTKTVFTGKGREPGGKRRYIMKWENDEWRLDEVQWWSGGWKRDYV